MPAGCPTTPRSTRTWSTTEPRVVTAAVQTPDNLDEPIALAREVAADGPWSAKIGAVKHNERHTASYYYELLSKYCSTVDVWRTTYHHPLANLHGGGGMVQGFGIAAFLRR